MMDFRDFEIQEHDKDTIVISQTNGENTNDRIYLDKKQIALFIGALSGNMDTLYTAELTCNVENEECYATIMSDSVQGLFNEKKQFFDDFVYNLDQNPLRGDDIEIDNIKKCIMVEVKE